MAALTPALAMLPLLHDAFVIAMAVTIIFGLMIATSLAMIFVTFPTARTLMQRETAIEGLPGPPLDVWDMLHGRPGRWAAAARLA